VIREQLVQQVQQVQYLDQQDRLVLQEPLELLERQVLHQQFLDLLVQLELQVVQVPQVQLVLMVQLDQLVRQEQQEQTVQQVQLDLPVQQVRQVLAQMLFQ
jgi:hypothetical protein